MSIAMPDWLGMLFDAFLLVAVIGLWLLWWQTSRKQRAIETLLAQASNELATASESIKQALLHVQRLKQDMPRQTTAEREDKPVTARTLEGLKAGQITRLLRMQREGKSVEAIAQELALPKAQVKLLLKLHNAGGS